MHILHISFKKSNRNNLFKYALRTKNVCVTAYDLFDPDDYEALLNDNYTYDALILGGQGGGDYQPSPFNINEIKPTEYINLLKMKPEKKLKLFQLVRKYENIPILGICYGAQLLNAFYGGSTTTKRDIRKTGYEYIHIDTENPLFKGLPSEIPVEFNTLYPSIPSDLGNIIAVTREDKMMSAQSFPNNQYALYFHIIHGDDTVLQTIVNNFINITERENSRITIMKVSALGFLFSLCVMFM